MKFKLLILTVFVLFLTLNFSCKKEVEPIIISPSNYHATIDRVIDIMVHDIFSPPVSSRVFVYPNIAAFEIIAQGNSNYNSLSGQIKHLGKIPEINKSEKVNYQLSALICHIELSKRLIFSEDKLIQYQDSLYQIWQNKNPIEFKDSKAYAMQVADYVGEWMKKDHYMQTRTMPKYAIASEDEGRWQPTPPSYMDGLEPNWNKIRPFVLDSASQFKPIPPPLFSMEKNSAFYKELIEVYNISKETEKKGDTCSEIQMAQFWDCNPYVSINRGHLMFASKKITPGAHWVLITKIACNSSKANFDKTVYAYTKTSIGIADAFISCWDEKYRSNVVRPETLINKYIDETWKPLLQTPPFPEYTSGHSVVSSAASKMLTSIFGENFKFSDDSELRYGLKARTFNSFNEAAQEAAISRVYGGIHYKSSVYLGIEQGSKVGNLINQNLKFTN